MKKVKVKINGVWTELVSLNTVNSVPSIIVDGNTVAWFDSKQQSTITKDSSNLVSRWNDRLLSGRDLIQTTTAKKPLFTEDGIYLDGVDDAMACAAFTLIQPSFIYIVLKSMTQSTNGHILTGFSWDSANLLKSEPNGFYANAGTPSTTNSFLPVNEYGILRLLFNGATSKLQIDETNPIIWNCGVKTMGGFTLGTRGNIPFQNAKIQVKEIIIRKFADSESNQLIITNYLKNKYAVGNQPQVCAIGDSTVATYLTYKSVASLLAYSTTNLAVSGETIDQQKNRFNALTTFENQRLDYVFAEIGLNDIAPEAVNMTEIYAKYQTMITDIKGKLKTGTKLILATMTPAKQRWVNLYGATNANIIYQNWLNLNDAIRGIGANAFTGQDDYIDTHTTALNDGSGFLLPLYDTGDGVHENDAGRLIIANAWSTKIL